jgi:hypothetical protein
VAGKFDVSKAVLNSKDEGNAAIFYFGQISRDLVRIAGAENETDESASRRLCFCSLTKMVT